MKCINCGRETKLGAAYALPFLVDVNGHYQNLYACSRECREEWRAAQRQVKQIQSQLSDREKMQNE